MTLYEQSGWINQILLPVYHLDGGTSSGVPGMSNVRVVSLSSRLMRGWVVPAICMSTAMLVGSYTQTQVQAQTQEQPEAQAPARKFRVGQAIEYKFGGMWLKGSIKTVSGELYLVGDPKARTDFLSQWMIADTIRQPGEAHEGPDAFSQFTHRVTNDTLPKSLVAARKELAAFRVKQSQKVTDPNTGRVDPFAALAFTQPVTEIDDTTARTFVFADLAQANGVSSKSASLDPASVQPNRVWSTPVKIGSGGPFEKPAQLTTNGQTVMLVLADNPPNGIKSVALERFDLATGRSTAQAAFDAASVPDDISADGRSIAAFANAGGSQNRTRVDLWDWSQAQPGHVVSFEAATGKGLDYVTAVRLLHDGSLLVKQNNGQATVYDAKSQSVTTRWTIKLHVLDPVEPSPGRKQIAIASDRRAVLINAATGDTLASLETTHFAPRRMIFSADGRYILLSSGNLYASWDLKTGTLSPRYAMPPSSRGQHLWITDAGQVFDGLSAIDPTSGAATLRYEPGTNLNDASTAPGVLLGVDMTNRRSPGNRKLWAWPTPRPAAQAKGPAVANLLAAGSRISIDLTAMEGSDAEKQQLLAALTEQFATMNVAVAPGQATSLVGRTTSKSEEKQYRDQGSPLLGKTQTANVTRKTTTLTIEHAGQSAWQVTSTVGPSGFSVYIQQGETLQTALDRQAQVKVSTFAAIPLPNIVPAPHTTEDVARRQLGQ